MSIMCIELVMPSNHLILSPPLLLLLSIFPSIRVCSSASTLRITWPKYRNFSFSIRISPSHEYSGLISFRMDWFDLLAVQVTHPTHQEPAAAAAKSLQLCPTLYDPIDGSPPGPLSLGFSRQEHWSGLPFPSPMYESEKWKWSRLVMSDS